MNATINWLIYPSYSFEVYRGMEVNIHSFILRGYMKESGTTPCSNHAVRIWFPKIL
jgi:hypothetical protein